MEDQNKYLPGYRAATEQFALHNPAEMAGKSDVPFVPEDGDGDSGYFRLIYLGLEYLVHHPTGKVTVPGREEVDEAAEAALTRRKILFLHYMFQASGAGPGMGWHAYRQMKGGDYHFGVFRTEALAPLVRHFGDELPRFRSAAVAAGGMPNGMGDAGYTFRILPRVSLGVVLYAGDDEEEATANIIFDDQAGENLPTDDLNFLAEDLVRHLAFFARSPLPR